MNSSLAKSILKLAAPHSDSSEVYISTSRRLKIDVLDQKVESVDEITEIGAAVRLIKKGRLGFAYTSDLHEEAIEALVSSAAANMQNSPQDELYFFPEAKKQTVAMDLVNKDIDGTSLDDKIKLALTIEKAAYEHDKRIKKSEKISYQDETSSALILNSKGVDVMYSKALCGAFADVIAEDEKQMETGSWMKFATRFSDLDPASIGKEAAKRAADMLGASPVKSGVSSIVLSPFAASILVSAMSSALSSESVQKGKSFFGSAVGKPVASRAFNLVDNGTLPSGLSSVPYDDEGVPTAENEIIKDGKLLTYLYSTYTAKKKRSSSTGNAFRDSFKSLPEIRPTNLYVKPGSSTPEDLMAGISKGFLVTNIMGAHTINPISGDFSIGFSGFLIENGKISRPVRGMTIAGNLLELLDHVSGIGSDLLFFPHNGAVGSPSVLVAKLSVSGT